MEYNGKYTIFDSSKVKTYPLKTRANKVKQENLIFPEDVKSINIELVADTVDIISTLARRIIAIRNKKKPVVFFTGAHLIKNGLGPLIIDLIKKGFLTLIAGNAATSIHDFELALIGETSEYVPNALGEGQFGMAYEFTFINTALALGNKYHFGYGESLGKVICDNKFRNEVLELVATYDVLTAFSHPEFSLLATCYENNVPFTVHAGIGVDVIDQHPSFDGQAKGGCSGRDFLIFAHEISKFTNGGILLNIGSAVQGPEVFLKAISMATNIGKKPTNLLCADFDLRDYREEHMTNEAASGYYFRDQKSVVTRIPQSFGGIGFYIQGNQKQTVPLLYQKIMEYC